jgi:hypothetical protein
VVAARAWFAVTLHVPIPITNFAMGLASRIDASIRHWNIMIAYETEVVGSFGKTPLTLIEQPVLARSKCGQLASNILTSLSAKRVC